MNYTNQNLLKPWVFQNRLDRFTIQSGPKTYSWKRIIARTSCVLRRRQDIFVIVDAMDHDPKDVSKEDVLNAQLATWVVSQQATLRFSRKDYHAMLKYNGPTQVEIDYDADQTQQVVHSYFSRTRSGADPLPTQLLAYLLISQPRFA